MALKQQQSHHYLYVNISWPIIKTALKVFNNETLPQDIDFCFNITTENDTEHQISQDFIIYFCTSHFMKAVSRNVKKHIKSLNTHFVMYSISVLSNTKDQSTFLGILNRFFTLLLSPT